MIYTVPHYYRQFCCLASSCPDTCCAGWGIAIDSESLRKYRNTKGALGNRLYHSINWKESSFRQHHRRCAFLNDHNLCDLYTEAGPASLCRTCRTYPRHVEEFEGCREISLSLSCIEAAKIILSCKDPVRFITRENQREETYHSFDFLLYTKLMDTRELLMEILQNRSLSWQSRISLCLGLVHDFQGRVQKGRLFETDAVLERCRQRMRGGDVRESLTRWRKNHPGPEGGRYQVMRKLFQIFEQMEVLNQEWPVYLRRLREVLYGEGDKAYERQRCAFLNSSWGEEMPLWSEQLMVYFVFTYFCGAVYDERPYGKLKLAVAGTLVIEEMFQALWVLEEANLEFMDLVDGAHRYSKEVEHSDRNKTILEQKLTFDEAFSLTSLLKAVNGL